jgi:hypothetical protein
MPVEVQPLSKSAPRTALARAYQHHDRGQSMKYISPWRSGWDHRPYWSYLETVKDIMPAELFAFASNPTNHDLSSPNSLHDAWLEEWSIAEVTLPNEKRSKRLIEIRARFLGPQHDRHIYLTYKNVGHYTAHNPEEFASPPTGRVGHGDLIIHELTVVREGLFEHELMFSRGTVFSVQFTGFEHRVEIAPTT